MEWLGHTCENPSLEPQNRYEESAVVVCACNPSNVELDRDLWSLLASQPNQIGEFQVQ